MCATGRTNAAGAWPSATWSSSPLSRRRFGAMRRRLRARSSPNGWRRGRKARSTGRCSGGCARAVPRGKGRRPDRARILRPRSRPPVRQPPCRRRRAVARKGNRGKFDWTAQARIAIFRALANGRLFGPRLLDGPETVSFALCDLVERRDAQHAPLHPAARRARRARPVRQPLLPQAGRSIRRSASSGGG